MSSDNSTLAVLGVQIAVKSGADTTRINEAIALVQKRYDDQVTRSHGSQGKDALLTFTALELADELLQLQKNQETERQRREFIANVSHELKTPMTTIGGFIDGILDGTIDSSKSTYYLRIVSDEVKRLSRLVTGMLNMSKIEAGQLKIQPKEFDISAMTFKTMLGFERAIDEKKIEIRGLDKVEPLNICADEDMINQVVYNLIDNAVKFTNEGGYIEVAIKSDSEKMIFSVKNSGKGISREEAGKVFERFYKTDKSRSYDVKGAGLGLYIVKTIIDMHGGQITVNSEPGEYTQFVFWLPLR